MKIYKQGLLYFAAGIFLLSLIWACDAPVKTENTAKESPALSPESLDSIKMKGILIAKQSFKVLNSKLTSAIEKEGVPGALQYCNLNASGLIDSISKANHVDIRRTSMKIRNQANAPSEIEKEQLAEFEKILLNGAIPQPLVYQNSAGKVVFHAPILTLPTCTQCHGTIGGDLKTENYDAILKIYPNDQATGFSMGQLRGMWTLVFD